MPACGLRSQSWDYPRGAPNTELHEKAALGRSARRACIHRGLLPEFLTAMEGVEVRLPDCHSSAKYD